MPLVTHMAPLSNAERQARFRQRLKDQARRGVTSETILQVIKETYEREWEEDTSMPTWDEYVRFCQTKCGHEHWRLNLPRSKHFAQEELDRNPTLRNTLAVIETVLNPPQPTD